MAVPELPTNFLSDKGSAESKVQGDLFPVNFFTPHGIVAANKQVRGYMINMMHALCMHMHGARWYSRQDPSDAFFARTVKFIQIRSLA